MAEAVTAPAISLDDVILRRAERSDVASIARIIASDTLASSENREHVTPEGVADSYYTAFESISRDPAHFLLVAEVGGRVVGTLQLTMWHTMGRQGGYRGHLETVFVDPSMRGKGIGSKMIGWALQHAKESGALLVDLSSNSTRVNAHRFYERMGFERTSVGFKIFLT
ncbi:putative acetyltransferase [Gonapodya prolifera JEL478]|uniref:Putative acetyltransferase n=1 Tax=Gonapodya prolifera (strain JEL478) TaxID=1344416 RepID=A0A139ASR5_GONPJ|nr:putative acetyltransferase [Gonapodya prolifera JEL478]|eukprot:KXS19525.1 putative acetyltransferase [Gonapodya prolifera JEL478]